MKILKVFFCMVLLWSCRERIIEEELPFAGERLLMYGVFTAKNPFKIYVSKTFPASGIPPTISQTYLPNALIEVYKNGKFLEVLTYQKNGFYGSSTLTEAGASYAVVAKATGLPVAQSSVIIVPVNSPKFSYKITQNIATAFNASYPHDRINVSLYDDSPTGNNRFYYMAFNGFYANANMAGASIFTVNNDTSIFDDDCGKGYTALAEWSFNKPLIGFVNTCFVNGQINRSYVIEKLTFDDTGKQSVMTHYTLHAGEMSKEYYEYLKTAHSPIGIEKVFQEPLAAYSNVSNGFGVIAGANEQTVTIINQ